MKYKVNVEFFMVENVEVEAENDIEAQDKALSILDNTYGDYDISFIFVDEVTDNEEVEVYEEPYDECGFDPYMGCYSYDC